MIFMDLLFKEYASPFSLLDCVIGSGNLNRFLDTFKTQRDERQVWEFYIHKLPPWDERTYEQFKHDIKFGKHNPPKIEKPSDEQLEATVSDSYKVLKNFEM